MLLNEIREHLFELSQERMVAEAHGMRAGSAYMNDLEEEIAACRRALVGVAVTEIAVLRGVLFGRDQG